MEWKARLETPEKDSQSTDFSAEVVNFSQGSFPSPLQISTANLSNVDSFPEPESNSIYDHDQPTDLSSQLVQSLGNIIPQLQCSDINKLSKPLRLKLFALLGRSLQCEIKKEAEHNRHPESREKWSAATQPSETVKLYKIEELLVFFESCSG